MAAGPDCRPKAEWLRRELTFGCNYQAIYSACVDQTFSHAAIRAIWSCTRWPPAPWTGRSAGITAYGGLGMFF